ncbi:MAG: GAF domain-containing protein [Anaerolineae bacterium]
MGTFWERLFDVSRYESPLERSRARLIYALIIIGGVLYTAYSFRVSPSSGRNVFQEFGSDIVTTVVMSVFYVLLVISMIATQRGYIRFGAVGPIAAWYVIGVIPALRSGIESPSDGMAFMLLVLLGGLLTGNRGNLISLILSVFSIIVGVALRATIPDAPGPQYAFSNSFLYIVHVLATAAITYMFMRFSTFARTEGATQATEERLKLAEITTSLAQSTSRREALSDVLSALVEQLVTAYPVIYHAQIFLVDDIGQDAKLVASTGAVGKLLLARAHALGVGSLSVIGQVIVRNEPIIAYAGREDSIHRRNEFLPETAVEAAFPLTVAGSVVGALDVQSRFEDSFRNEEVLRIFSSLSDSIAIAIDNARLFEQAEQRVRENQRLVEQTRAALREVEQLNERLTGRAWSEYLRNKTDEFAVKLEFDADDTQPDRIGRKKDKGWSETLEEAMRLNYIVQDSQNGKRVVAVPLRVRGQVVGAMEFELDDDGQFSSEELNLVQEVGERFGLAAENNRLLEESQRLALREALVNEISNRLQASNNVETTLTEAARSLQDSLKAAKVAIRLGQPPKETAR